MLVLTYRFLPEFLSRPPSGATLPPGEGIGEGGPYGIISAFFRIIKKRYSCIRTVGMIYYQ